MKKGANVRMSTLARLPHNRLGGIGLAAAVLTLGACGGGEDAPAAQGGEPDAMSTPLTVLAVNYPLAYFAQRLGGDAVDARYPGPAEGDPALWSPTPEEVAGFQEADLILLNGADYAAWVSRVTLSEARIVNTSSAFTDAYIVEESAVTHSHGPEGEHAHGQTAFTTWLDLAQALEQAGAVADALAEALPDQEPQIRGAFDQLVLDLGELDGTLAGWGIALDGAPVIASHPVYQYFARAYGVNLESVHWEPGEAPAASDWQELEVLRERHPADLMIWEGEPLPEVRSRLEEMGIRVVVFDPVSTIPASGDFLSVMRTNVEGLPSAPAADRRVATPTPS